MQMQLILVWLGTVQDLDVGALHPARTASATQVTQTQQHSPNSQPLASWTESQGEDLGREVVLLQLPSLAKVPGANRVVQSTSPQLGSFSGDVDARGAVRMSLELTNQLLVVQIPDGDVTVAAAAEADVGVWTDGQSVTSRGIGGEFCLDSRRRSREIPDADGTRFPSDDQRPVVGKQLTRPDVVVSLLQRERKRERERSSQSVGRRMHGRRVTYQTV